jgi:hypothetical protein
MQSPGAVERRGSTRPCCRFGTGGDPIPADGYWAGEELESRRSRPGSDDPRILSRRKMRLHSLEVIPKAIIGHGALGVALKQSCEGLRLSPRRFPPQGREPQKKR